MNGPESLTECEPVSTVKTLVKHIARKVLKIPSNKDGQAIDVCENNSVDKDIKENCIDKEESFVCSFVKILIEKKI